MISDVTDLLGRVTEYTKQEGLVLRTANRLLWYKSQESRNRELKLNNFILWIKLSNR